MKSFSDNLKKGDKLYYPSNNGLALVCRVIEKTKKDALVEIRGQRYFIPLQSIDQHGVRYDNHSPRVNIQQYLDDPDHNLVYVRYTWDDTFIDRLYNRYCKLQNRLKG